MHYRAAEKTFAATMQTTLCQSAVHFRTDAGLRACEWTALLKGVLLPWYMGAAVRYRLNFFEEKGSQARVLNIEAPSEDAAIERCCIEAVGSAMTVDLWQAEEFIIRMTPMTARLYGCESPRPMNRH